MVVLTIRRPSGIIEQVPQPQLSQGWLRSEPQIARAKASIKAAGKGELLSVTWADDQPAPTAEQQAWQQVEALRSVALDAEATRFDDSGTGLGQAAAREAQAAYDTARAAYLATYGEQAPSITAARERAAAEQARRDEEHRTSFVARGLD